MTFCPSPPAHNKKLPGPPLRIQIFPSPQAIDAPKCKSIDGRDHEQATALLLDTLASVANPLHPAALPLRRSRPGALRRLLKGVVTMPHNFPWLLEALISTVQTSPRSSSHCHNDSLLVLLKDLQREVTGTSSAQPQQTKGCGLFSWNFDETSCLSSRTESPSTLSTCSDSEEDSPTKHQAPLFPSLSGSTGPSSEFMEHNVEGSLLLFPPLEGATASTFILERSPRACQLLLGLFGQVGVGARRDAFPPYCAEQCRRYRQQCLLKSWKRAFFTVIERKESKGKSSARRGYAICSEIQRCLAGSVREARVVTKFSEACFELSEERVVIKCIEKRRLGALRNDESPLHEIAALQYVHLHVHPHDPRRERIVKIIDCFEDDDLVFLVMPYYDTDLFSYMDEKTLSEEETFVIVRDIVDGIELLHSVGVAHHDLSLENILINRNTGRAAIIDLGMVVKVPQCSCSTPKIAPSPKWPCRTGKVLYMSKEASQAAAPFDPFKLDSWALGIIMFILFTGAAPFDIDKHRVHLDRRRALIMSNQVNAILHAWKVKLPPDATQLLNSLLRENIDERIPIPGVRFSEWYLRLSSAQETRPYSPELDIGRSFRDLWPGAECGRSRKSQHSSTSSCDSRKRQRLESPSVGV